MGRKCITVQEGYERWAPNYDVDPNPLLSLEERQLVRMLPPLEHKRALDLACGTGRWLSWLRGEGVGAAVGMDLSPAMLAVAKEKLVLQGRLVHADCRALPFANAIFDLVICSFAVGHIPDLRNVAREVGRVASVDADLYVSDLHPLAYAQGWHTGFRDREGAAEIITWPRSVQELQALWSNGGFNCIQSVDCRLGEPERLILAQAGKAHLFGTVRSVPVALLCHFRRRAY